VACTTLLRDKGGQGYGVRQLGTPINAWPVAFFQWLDQNRFAKSNQ
jgi:hypothetical protein